MPLRPEASSYQGPSAVTRAAWPPGRAGEQADWWADRRARRRAALFASLPPLLTFTVDVEDPGSGGLEAPTRRLLDMLEAAGGGRGTFFVLGEAARQAPGLVREIARRGHEVASHGEWHRALEEEQPAEFRHALAGAKARLEDLAGQQVLGYRAPMFSLTPRTAPWATEALDALGFAYSSSVVPAWNFLYGFPGAPRRPFLWTGDLLEIPCPVGRIGPLALPFLGGMYLRYLPPWRLRGFACQPEAASGGAVWSYCHPYDLDTEARFARAHDRGLVASLMLWLHRGGMAPRLAALLEGRTSVPFAARLEGLRAEAVPFRPGRRG